MFEKINDIYDKKSLIWILAVTDLKLRYRNSVLGFLWSILEPLFLLLVLYIVFNYILRSDVENYPLFLLIGLITWNTFSRGTSMGSNSILARAGIVLTIPLTKIVLPISSVVTSFLMLFFELTIFVVFMIGFQFIPPISIIYLPLVFIPLFIFTLGMALSLSVLNVLYRDVSYIWTIILQAGFFLTPIIYKINILPETLQEILMLNPMAHIVIWVQDFAIFGQLPSLESVAYTFTSSIVMLIVGLLVFYKLQGKMVDKL
jgi:lipopolysaccharide transport system permease protein